MSKKHLKTVEDNFAKMLNAAVMYAFDEGLDPAIMVGGLELTKTSVALTALSGSVKRNNDPEILVPDKEIIT